MRHEAKQVRPNQFTIFPQYPQTHTHAHVHANTHTCMHTHTHTHKQQTGLVILMMLFTTCVCYLAFVALCCGDFGRLGRICGLVSFCIVAAALIIYFVWLGTGTYFLVVLDPSELTRSACRSYAFYMGFLYAYICVFICVHHRVYLEGTRLGH